MANKSSSSSKKTTSTSKSSTSKSTASKSTASRSAATQNTSAQKSTTSTRSPISQMADAAVASGVRASKTKNKKKRNLWIALCIILVIAIVTLVIVGYFQGWFDGLLGKKKKEVLGDFSAHFLELGNKYTGDCTYLKIGDIDVLIDAGSRQNSAGTITKYIDQYCTDGKLEYVIVTHAHQDHIAAFVGTLEQPGIFDKYECGTIIQFTDTQVTTQIYKDYCTKREMAEAKGAKVHKALDCVNNANGAQKVYDITGDGSVTMEVLYHKFYSETPKANEENNNSVCVLFTQGSNHYLFTGDLEKPGESSLVDNNPDLPHVQLYKGGHHGSATASSEKLINKITPEYVCVCSCAGTEEYPSAPQNIFPSQDFVDHIAPYTDKVFITTLIVDYQAGQYESLNGNIVFSCTKGEITINCSNNNTLLKDTDWFKNNRTCPEAWKKKD